MDGNFGPTEQVLWPISVFSGIIMCKIVYEITGRISSLYYKGYNKLSKSQKIEWNNRGFSTFHAILAAAVSFYLVVLSDTFKDGDSDDFVVNRKSMLSDAMFGILHHGLSMYSFLLSLISGKGQIYILMVLFTEITTPFVNLRWYLDLAGQKNSTLYIYNGVAMFLGWLVARILLFIYFFAHMYLHFDQVKTIFPLGFYSLLVVPSMLAVMNVLWFRKILMGMIKTLSKKHEK